MKQDTLCEEKCQAKVGWANNAEICFLAVSVFDTFMIVQMFSYLPQPSDATKVPTACTAFKIGK